MPVVSGIAIWRPIPRQVNQRSASATVFHGRRPRNHQPPTVSAGRQRRVSVKARGQPVRNAALHVHAVQPWPRTIGIAGEVHQGPPVQQHRISHPPIVRRDPFGSSTGRTNAPDVQFVRQRTLDEVDECRVGRPQRKVAVKPGRRGEDGALSGRRPPSDTNSGSPGPGVWYASREPSCDQSNSATPSRYGLGSPPSVGTAQMPMSPPFDRLACEPKT